MSFIANIFETDPEAGARVKQTTDGMSVGRIHLGTVRGGRPMTLESWRFTTGDREIASALAQLFGGSPHEYDPEKEFNLEIVTDADSIPVIVDGPDAIRALGEIWINGKLTHRCDGVSFVTGHPEPALIGLPCGCPRLLRERKEAAKNYQAASPAITITFRLADDPDLGEFTLRTGSWQMAGELHNAVSRLERFGESYAHLRTELVEWTTSAGQSRSFRKPVLDVKKSWNDAVAE